MPRAPSLADVLWFESLPPDVRERVELVFGANVNDSSIKQAYLAGFEAGVDSCEVTSNGSGDFSFNRWLDSQRRREREN